VFSSDEVGGGGAYEGVKFLTMLLHPRWSFGSPNEDGRPSF
jgi:hypothetical protein